VVRGSRRGTVHAPEEAAARYIEGGGGRRWRQRFEAHLLECEDCWREVRAARAGRSLAERARELAPASLREDVRAAISLSGIGPWRRRAGLLRGASVLMALAVTAGAVTLVGSLRKDEQPSSIRAALATYRSDRLPAVGPVRSAPDLASAGLQVLGGGHQSLDGVTTDVFRFVDRQGNRIFVFLANRAFPEASGATERAGTVHGWEAVADGVHMVCADAPVSYLVMGAEPSLVERAEDALRDRPPVRSGG
jgi:hypothetical protein